MYQRALRLIHGGLSKQKLQPSKGITIADVLRVFPGAKVILPTAEDLTKPSCQHCVGNEHAKVVKRTWSDGRWDWMCHRCGRRVQRREPGANRAHKKGENAYALTHKIDGLKPAKGVNMNISQYPIKYLKASDLQGHSRKFTIARVEVEYSNFDDREIWVVYFEDERKGWCPSQTSINIIARISGLEDTDDWAGVSITLYPAMFKRRGKEIETIRVQEPPNGNSKDELSNSNEPSDDEIPF
jgi:hypothetical protein